jgi:hypothetical protein
MTDELEQIPIQYIELWDEALQRWVTMKIGGAWVPKKTIQEKEAFDAILDDLRKGMDSAMPA